MDRLINYFFGLTTIYLFIIEGRAEDHFLILTGLLFSLIIAYIAFLGNWITLDATKAVMVLGTITLGFGGWWLAFALIFFFASSGLLTRRKLKRGIVDPEKRGIHHDLQKRRDGYQVWANGFWIGIFVIGWFLTSLSAFLAAAFAVIATATADTWATELGTFEPGETRMINSLEIVEPGTDGGISFKGTAAAFAGSFFISLFILPVFDLSLSLMLLILFSGFAGALVDSFAGAILQKRTVNMIKPGDYVNTSHTLKNSLVNWISTGIGGLIAFLIAKIVFL